MVLLFTSGECAVNFKSGDAVRETASISKAGESREDDAILVLRDGIILIKFHNLQFQLCYFYSLKNFTLLILLNDE